METHLVEMQKRLVDLQSERDLLRSQLKIAVEALELIQMRREGFENDLWRCPVMASEGLEAIRKVGVPDEA